MTAKDEDEAAPRNESQRGLDWLNFFIADVQTAFGPFIAVYLIANGWSQGMIGVLLTVGALTGIASDLPGGAIVDAVARKRRLIAIALAMIAAGALIFAFFANPVMIFIAEILHGATAGIIRPAEVAIGLGLVGHRALSTRLGRNQRYQSFGNAATAAAMGVLGQLIAKSATFLFAAALCLPAAYALTRIHPADIDYARARAARDRRKPREAARWRDLAKNRVLLVFVGALVLFQLANASLTPLAVERLGQQHQSQSELFTAALVIVPQLVTALLAAWIARRAQDWGRKPLLLAGFGVLPLRAVLFVLASGPWSIVAIQVTDGISAAVIGILTPLLICDVTRGSGRYNFAQGVAGTAQGIGGAVSTVAIGFLAQGFGYAAGFLALAAIGAAGLAVILCFLPETMPGEFRAGRSRTSPARTAS
ncbi:MAG TPA: MFS transporter [Stellaceae bacterium]|jgi:MFS family permease